LEATVTLHNRTDVNRSISAHAFFTLCGSVPIPPYLNREATAVDEAAYQTVYANDAQTGSVAAPTAGLTLTLTLTLTGSVAAPTAGLHFTSDLLDEIFKASADPVHDDKVHVKRSMSKLSLHVGAGTFQPVTADNIQGHTMHTEQFSVSKTTLKALQSSLARGDPIIPVGTTSVRTLETLYWLGVRESLAGGGMESPLGQWEPYDLSQKVLESGSISLPKPEDALGLLMDRYASS